MGNRVRAHPTSQPDDTPAASKFNKPMTNFVDDDKSFLIAQDLAVELPRALRFLSGSTSNRGRNGVETHGHVAERVSSVDGSRVARVK
jgi:hypothetical protein